MVVDESHGREVNAEEKYPDIVTEWAVVKVIQKERRSLIEVSFLQQKMNHQHQAKGGTPALRLPIICK